MHVISRRFPVRSSLDQQIIRAAQNTLPTVIAEPYHVGISPLRVAVYCLCMGRTLVAQIMICPCLSIYNTALSIAIYWILEWLHMKSKRKGSRAMMLRLKVPYLAFTSLPGYQQGHHHDQPLSCTLKYEPLIVETNSFVGPMDRSIDGTVVGHALFARSKQGTVHTCDERILAGQIVSGWNASVDTGVL